jgi:putative peptidoglycan lipid II flippase
VTAGVPGELRPRSAPARFASIALAVGTVTLAARIVGFGRSVVFSKTVGDTCLGDAYNAANQLPNVLFEIVAGGVLAGVVVPVVARHVEAGRRAAATATASALMTWTVLALTPAALLALLGSRLYAAVFAAPSCPGSASLLAALLVTFVPQIWLYGLAVVSAGILQAHSRFLAAAVAPMLSSIVVITAYLTFALAAADRDGTDLTTVTSRTIAVLGWGTTAGVLTLALSTLVPLTRLGLRLRPRLRFAGGDRRAILGIAAAGLVGLVLQQLSQLLVLWAARQTDDPGAVTRITWAGAIYLLPFAVLVAPVLQLVFPRLSAAAERGNAEVAQVLARTVPVVALLAGLGTALLAATAVPVARVFVIGPGSNETAGLAAAIVAFAPAVVGFALLGLASRTLLAQHRATSAGTVTASAWGSVILAVAAAVLLPSGWVVPALGAATSAGMMVGAATGWVLVRRSVPTLAVPRRPLLVVLVATAASAGITGPTSRTLSEAGIATATAGAVGCAALCTVVYVGVVAVGDRDMVKQVLSLRRRQPEGART